jgi:hypothetical protein
MQHTEKNRITFRVVPGMRVLLQERMDKFSMRSGMAATTAAISSGVEQ